MRGAGDPGTGALAGPGSSPGLLSAPSMGKLLAMTSKRLKNSQPKPPRAHTPPLLTPLPCRHPPWRCHSLNYFITGKWIGWAWHCQATWPHSSEVAVHGASWPACPAACQGRILHTPVCGGASPSDNPCQLLRHLPASARGLLLGRALLGLLNCQITCPDTVATCWEMLSSRGCDGFSCSSGAGLSQCKARACFLLPIICCDNKYVTVMPK